MSTLPSSKNITRRLRNSPSLSLKRDDFSYRKQTRSIDRSSSLCAEVREIETDPITFVASREMDKSRQTISGDKGLGGSGR